MFKIDTYEPSKKIVSSLLTAGLMLSSAALSAPWDRTTYSCVNEDSGRELKIQTTSTLGGYKYRIGDATTPTAGSFKPVKETNISMSDYKNVPDGEYGRHDSIVNLLFVMTRKDTLLSQSLIEGREEGTIAIGSIETMVYSELYSLIRYDIYDCERY